MKKSHIFFAVLIVAIWGANAAIGKIAMMQMPTMLFLSIRFLLTTIIFIPFAKLKKGELKKLFNLAIILNVFHYGFTFYSMKLLDASSLGVILQTEVPIAMLLGAIFLHEKISKSAMLGIFLSFVGIIVVLGIPNLNLFGFILGLIGSLFWAIGNIQMKQLKKINSYAFIAYTCLFSLPFLITYSFLFEDVSIKNLSTINITEISFVLFFQVIICAIAIMAWQNILAKNPASKVVPFLLLQPVFAVIAGIMLFNEVLHINLIIGGIIITAGLYLTLLERPKKQDIKKEIE